MKKNILTIVVVIFVISLGLSAYLTSLLKKTPAANTPPISNTETEKNPPSVTIINPPATSSVISGVNPPKPQATSTQPHQAEKILDELTRDLKAGDIDSALLKIPPDERNKFKFLAIFASQGTLNQLADSISQRRLISETPTRRVYESTWTENGKTTIRNFEVIKNNSGSWYVINWYQ